MAIRYINTETATGKIAGWFKVKFSQVQKHNLVSKFTDSEGKEYGRHEDGSIVRLSPLRPWKGKSERRKILAARRSGLKPISLDAK